MTERRKTFAEAFAAKKNMRAVSILGAVAESQGKQLAPSTLEKLAIALTVPTKEPMVPHDEKGLHIGALPDCKDPFDYIMKHGGAAFQKVVDNAEHIVDYKYRRLVEESVKRDGNLHARAKAIREAVEWFGQYLFYRQENDTPAEMDLVLRGQIYLRLSKLSGLTVEEVRGLIEPKIAEEMGEYHERITGIQTTAEKQAKQKAAATRERRKEARIGGSPQ